MIGNLCHFVCYRAWRKFENIYKSYRQAHPEFTAEIVDADNMALVAVHVPLGAFTEHFPELKVLIASPLGFLIPGFPIPGSRLVLARD